MDHEEVGGHWDANFEVWTRLARASYDIYRDVLNTPAFLEMLPEVGGLYGLDEAGFVPERFGKPYPADEAVREHPWLQSAQVFAYFLHVRARRPG